MALHTAYLNIGSNIDKDINIPRAIQRLKEYVDVLACSKLYETPFSTAYMDDPKSYSTPHPSFHNIAVLIQTPLSAAALKSDVITKIESEFHRDHSKIDRPIDIDITCFDDQVIPELKIPDPLLIGCTHLLLPLADIAPDYLHPIEKKQISDIAKAHTPSAYMICEPIHV